MIHDCASALKAFYNAYNDWVEQGAITTHSTFDRAEGLCFNLTKWARQQGLPAVELVDTLKGEFVSTGLDEEFPFDVTDYWGRSPTFVDARLAAAQHLNPKRMAWVKAQLK